jgi:hypothetical protein
MKKKPHDQRDWHEGRIEETRKKTASVPDTPQSPETVSKRTKKPGGLANAARPGLGSREDDAVPDAADAPPRKEKSGAESKPRATRNGYEEPRPEPREQASDSFAHEQERSTGVSGHTGNT